MGSPDFITNFNSHPIEIQSISKRGAATLIGPEKSEGGHKYRIVFNKLAEDRSISDQFALAIKSKEITQEKPSLYFFERWFGVVLLKVKDGNTTGYVKAYGESIRKRFGINKEEFNKAVTENQGDVTDLVNEKLNQVVRQQKVDRIVDQIHEHIIKYESNNAQEVLKKTPDLLIYNLYRKLSVLILSYMKKGELYLVPASQLSFLLMKDMIDRKTVFDREVIFLCHQFAEIQNDPEAMYLLGEYYLKIHPDKGREWLKKAANLNYPDAKQKLKSLAINK